MKYKSRPLALAIALGYGIAAGSAHAVRVNPDGHGQALIYPYYTVRNSPSGNPYVSAFSVTNMTSRPKALRVRFLESKNGGEIHNFNLYLAAYDVWTAGVVQAGIGAGLFTNDNSCTSPLISRNASAPTTFRNYGYLGDMLGDSLDRTAEGYLEILEMGSIDPLSELGKSVTHASDYSAPGVSKPSCKGLPYYSFTIPDGLSRPTGGLSGTISYINVNDGTDFSVSAIALAQWSDKVQWTPDQEVKPSLADASPPVSFVQSTDADADTAYLTTWARGKDAVSAVLMVAEIDNDFTVETSIRAATDWVISMPTKRFYASGAQSERPFAGSISSSGTTLPSYCERRIAPDLNCSDADYYDREAQKPGNGICFFGRLKTYAEDEVCGATAILTFSGNSGTANTSRVLNSNTSSNMPLYPSWINGWLPYRVQSIGRGGEFVINGTAGLPAPVGATTVVDLTTGNVSQHRTVTYYGLPIIGFAVQSYSTTGLPGVSTNVLSNYGGQFTHKVRRRIDIAP